MGYFCYHRRMSYSLFEKYQHLDQRQIFEEFCKLCAEGNLEEVRFLSTCPDLKHRPNANWSQPISFSRTGRTEKRPLTEAASQGQINVIDYLLTSPALSDEQKPTSSTVFLHAFEGACAHGQLEVIKYFLDNQRLTITGIASLFLAHCVSLAALVQQWPVCDYLSQDPDFHLPNRECYEVLFRLTNTSRKTDEAIVGALAYWVKRFDLSSTDPDYQAFYQQTKVRPEIEVELDNIMVAHSITQEKNKLHSQITMPQQGGLVNKAQATVHKI